MKIYLFLFFTLIAFSSKVFLISTNENFTSQLEKSTLSENLEVLDIKNLSGNDLKSDSYLVTFQELKGRYNLIIIYLNKDYEFGKKRQFEEIDSYYLIRSDIYTPEEIKNASDKVIETFDKLKENGNF